MTGLKATERIEYRSAAQSTEPAANLLVVDDDPVVRCLLQVCLPRMGFSVWTADSGEAAVAFFEQNQDRVDAILLDVRMPVLDGPATLRELRQLDPSIPCCFMSGHTGSYTTEALLQMGATALLDKPFDLDELSRTLHRVIEHAGLRRTA